MSSYLDEPSFEKADQDALTLLRSSDKNNPLVSSTIEVDRTKKKYTCCSYTAPFFVYFLLACANTSVIILEFIPLKENDAKNETVSYEKYVALFFYEFVIIMAIWSHLRVMTADPGYIDYNYEYDTDYMTVADAAILKYILLSSHKSNPIDHKDSVSMSPLHVGGIP